MDSKIQAKIKTILDELQGLMEDNIHLTDPDRIEILLEKASIYWAHMSDEDKDYCHGSRYALDEKKEWVVPPKNFKCNF